MESGKHGFQSLLFNIFMMLGKLFESENESRLVVSNFLWPHGLYSPWNSPDQNTGVDSLSLFQGIFPTQGSNADLLHCRRILYQLSHKRSPRILEWIAYPFSSGSSRPKSWTRVSSIAGGFFTNWANREAFVIAYMWADLSHIGFGAAVTLCRKHRKLYLLLLQPRRNIFRFLLQSSGQS